MLQNSSAFPFTHRFRVRYAELDPQAVVFNSRYLEYADLVITEFWRAVGMPFTAEDALEFHVARAVVDFKKPLRADELIEARARVSRFGNTSMTTEIELHGPGADDLRARIELVHVHVDLQSGQSQPIPEHVRARFLSHAGTLAQA
ncbi:thioesterase family protein [Sphingomonas sp. LaA6.9]|uniref:acyl-CoA thioesterase n=1 Tax=Sphingomonas sp. LaA6.9 TaxID=2919914 RepID=UPI001F4F1D15|nr:thioesterase family protein [Sphingomonas sp. LaA6.9]MCJ8156521.1 acyl-CoA thioesterase [Sphingomonas sp. LaA6.9]